MPQTLSAEAGPARHWVQRTSAGLDLDSGSLRHNLTSLCNRSPLEYLGLLLGRDVLSTAKQLSEAIEKTTTVALSPDFLAFLWSKDRPTMMTVKAPLSFQELAQLATLRLSLSKTDMARLLGVSRPTLYNWLAGGEPDDPRAQEGLRFLGTVAEEISRTTPRPLYRRFVYEAMPGEERSIIQLLETETWDESLLRRLFRKARELTSLRDERLGIHARLSPEAEEANFHDNFLSLGGY